MDDWKTLPKTEDVYSHLNMEDITDADYVHTKVVCKDFFTALVLAWQAALKNAKVKLDLITDIDLLLMVEKGVRGGISLAIHRHVKADNKYMKDYDKN